MSAVATVESPVPVAMAALLAKPSDPSQLTCWDLIEDARSYAERHGIPERAALTLLTSSGRHHPESVTKAAKYFDDVERMRWAEKLVRGEADAELAFVCGGVCCCQKCARGYLMDPVNCRIDYDMLLETRVVPQGDDWSCDCCDASCDAGSQRELYRKGAMRNG